MVFSSITFLFFFLPATLLAYYVTPRRWRNTLLFLASVVFYAWGTGGLVLVLLLSIASNYWLGRALEDSVDRDRHSRAKVILGCAVVLNLGLLAWFKYATFAVAQASAVLTIFGHEPPVTTLEILLPIGISFYTFHSLSYLIDLYRGVARRLASPIDFGLYITFFPQLVAGPIVRFHEIRDQLVSRRETRSQFSIGVYRFGHGFAKKVLIADTVAPVADAAFAVSPSELTSPGALLGVAAYTVQLYFDFSGYSDMAIGLAHMVGIRLPENFARPYASRSVTEFWRRWHMSLSRWFRDYLYIPLGGNRGSTAATYRNLIVVFLATGLWHGANWTFVLWGAYHGFLLLFERRFRIASDADAASGLSSTVAQLRTVGLVTAGWILFRSPDVDHAFGYLGAIGRIEFALPVDLAAATSPVAVLALVIGLASMVLPSDWVTGTRLEHDRSSIAEAARIAVAAVAFPLAVIVLVAGDFSPFLYFQF